MKKKTVKQADGKTLVIDPTRCIYPPACPGCSNCDTFVSLSNG